MHAIGRELSVGAGSIHSFGPIVRGQRSRFRIATRGVEFCLATVQPSNRGACNRSLPHHGATFESPREPRPRSEG